MLNNLNTVHFFLLKKIYYYNKYENILLNYKKYIYYKKIYLNFYCIGGFLLGRVI